MFQIECPGCMTTYKVSTEMVGKRLPCKKCGRTIRVMRPSQHAQAKKAANQLPMILIGVGVIGVAIVAFILSRGDDPDPLERSSSVASSGDDAPSVETKAGSAAEGEGLDPRGSVFAFLRALENFDQPKVMGLISHHRFSEQFPPAKEILTDRRYGELDGSARGAYERELFDILLSEELRGATRLSPPEVQGPIDREHNDVEMIVRTEDRGKQAEMRFVLVKSTGLGWKVAELHRSGSYFEEAASGPLASRGAGAGDDGEAASSSSEARGGIPVRNDHIAPVPPLEDTSPELASQIEGHIATVMDLSKTSEAVEARNELLRIGKPAIPYLLNAIAEKGVETIDDMLIVNQAVITLRDLTGQRFGFSPQMGLATSAGRTQEEIKSEPLKKWFGWWRTYGKQFVPPEQPEEIRIPEHRKRNATKKVGG